MLELRNVSCQVDTGDKKKEIFTTQNFKIKISKFVSEFVKKC